MHYHLAAIHHTHTHKHTHRAPWKSTTHAHTHIHRHAPYMAKHTYFLTKHQEREGEIRDWCRLNPVRLTMQNKISGRRDKKNGPAI